MVKDSILRGLRVLRTWVSSAWLWVWLLTCALAKRLASLTILPAAAKIKTSWQDRSRRFQFIWQAAVVPAAILIILLIHKNVYSYMDRHEQYRVDFRAFHNAVVPTWARPYLTKADAVPLNLPEGGTLMDSETVGQVTRAMERHPWIEQVIEARRIYPDRVSVTLRYRAPLLAVEKSGRYVLVDQHQIRLPGTYRQVPKLADPIYIVSGVRASAPAAGQVWEADDLQAACDVAQLLQQNPSCRRYQIMGIDVANVNGRLDRKQGEIALRTEDGIRILWGNAVHSKRFGDITASEKIENLELAFRSYPRFKGLRYVKVYAKGRAIIMEGQDLAQK